MQQAQSGPRPLVVARPALAVPRKWDGRWGGGERRQPSELTMDAAAYVR